MLYRSHIYRAVLPGLLRRFGPLHVGLYRLLRGRLVGRASQGFIPLLLLTTIGRRSGRRRTQPLGYVGDGSGFIIIGSNGALPVDPGWIFNLRDHPQVDVQVGGKRTRMRAHILGGEERADAWRKVTERYGFFDAYQGAVTRSIPVVRLDPEADLSSPRPPAT